jgi:Domain of unknown function (DUF5658)
MARLTYWVLTVLTSAVVSQATVRGQQLDPGTPSATPIADAVAQAAKTAPVASSEKSRRPAALIPLYAGLVGLQVLDYTSTVRAVETGSGLEGNPLMSPIVENRAAFLALKAGSTACALWASEKMWKRHRVGAVVFMAALDGTMVAVVAHNYSIKR